MIQPHDRVRVIAPGKHEGSTGRVLHIATPMQDILDPIHQLPMFDADAPTYAIVRMCGAVRAFPVSALTLHKERTE